MRVEDFLEAVQKIVDEAPTYRLGGDGRDGTCDCVGLLMGAIRRVDRSVKFPLHSSNYFARQMVVELLEISSPEELEPGMAVFKTRADTGQLNARYKKGGKYDTGDYRDFYHVGVVRTVEPLQIEHCTSSDEHDGIVVDSKLGKWSTAAKIKDVVYNTREGATDMTRNARIQTDDGKTLNLRKGPGQEYDTITRMPNGNTVKVLADAKGWAKIEWNGLTGYCMSKYLVYDNDFSGETTGDKVMFSVDRAVAESVYAYLAEVLGH